MAERYHKRFFHMVPLPEGTTFESRTEAMCGFNVAGPQSRELLQTAYQRLARDRGFSVHALAGCEIAGVDCLALRVSFTGDLGWELHCAAEDQVRLYAALLEAGRALGAGRWAAAR
jgi:dimethylglycine dehydrogenase